jgi:hypothetical protein
MTIPERSTSMKRIAIILVLPVLVALVASGVAAAEGTGQYGMPRALPSDHGAAREYGMPRAMPSDHAAAGHGSTRVVAGQYGLPRALPADYTALTSRRGDLITAVLGAAAALAAAIALGTLTAVSFRRRRRPLRIATLT